MGLVVEKGNISQLGTLGVWASEGDLGFCVLNVKPRSQARIVSMPSTPLQYNRSIDV